MRKPRRGVIGPLESHPLSIGSRCSARVGGGLGGTVGRCLVRPMRGVVMRTARLWNGRGGEGCFFAVFWKVAWMVRMDGMDGMGTAGRRFLWRF